MTKKVTAEMALRLPWDQIIKVDPDLRLVYGCPQIIFGGAESLQDLFEKFLRGEVEWCGAPCTIEIEPQHHMTGDGGDRAVADVIFGCPLPIEMLAALDASAARLFRNYYSAWLLIAVRPNEPAAFDRIYAKYGKTH